MRRRVLTIGYGPTHYSQERMGQIVLINPPAIFHMFWKACKPILDNVTKEKIVMLRGAKDIAQYAAEHWQKVAFRNPRRNRSRFVPRRFTRGTHLLRSGVAF